MKTSHWMILGALAGLTGIAINKQLRLARHRLSETDESEATTGRASIDDVPTLQPQAGADSPRATDEAMRFDESVAPSAPM